MRFIAPTLALLLLAAPAALAAPGIDLDRLQAIARKEGMPLAGVRVAGQQRLLLSSTEDLPRSAFLKRAGLLAFVVFKRLPTKVQAIQFTNRHAGGEQNCRILRTDFEAYLGDTITKPEYERRVGYREEGMVPLAHGPATLPGIPLAPVMRPLQLLAPLPIAGDAPRPAIPRAPIPVVAAAPTLLGLSYGLALGGGRYDAYQLEYGHPMLPSLDLRPSIQIISGFSPVNFMNGASRPADGLSFACDLMGTTRQHPGWGGLAFEGGLGARVASVQGTSAGTWPAMHLRLGLSWSGLNVGMRYPLLHAGGDPTGTWEASLGYSVPFSAFGGS
ncbi:MAG: hypothetical protein JWM80_1668 [Cyanobacteria bacterium RYN_339]|nr:hypothetical protein [Cyanobacteria bacterium RYN_339]